MRATILARLRELGAADRLELEAKIRSQLSLLERELAEVQQLVPFWNRVAFFIETADVRREKDLVARIAATRAELVRARRDVRRDLDQVGFELPPFAVACDVEDCLDLASREAADRQALPAVLERLAKRLTETWAPGFDPEPVLERLTSATACREAAALVANLPRDPVLGYARAEDQLVPLLAARILAGPYFQEQEKAGELTTRRNRLDAELEAAEACVSVFEKLNPFSFAPSEVRRNEIAKTHELRECRDRGLTLLEDALAAYPPLELTRLAQDAIAVSLVSEPERETTLTAGGRVVETTADGARVLTLAALERLRARFRAAFPETPFPRDLASELGATPEAPRASVDPIVRAYLGELARSPAASVRERALEHVARQANTRRRLDRVKRAIPLAERLAFWQESEAKDERARLEARERWHKDGALHARRELLALARDLAATLPPFRLRDTVVEAVRRLDDVSVNEEDHVLPQVCWIPGLEGALASLEKARKILEDAWSLGGTETEILEEVAQAEPAAVAIAAHDRLVWKPLRRGDLVRLLASRLERTGFHETYRRVRAVESRERSATAEKAEVASRLSIWDHLNVFSKTPDKQRNSELKRSLANLGAELEAAVELLRSHLDHALHVYPPARLYYSLGAVERAVREIHVESRVHWVTVVTRERVLADDDGVESERWVERSHQELRYHCVLVGKEEAVFALGQWAATFVACFGAFPGYHELLETWASTPAPALARTPAPQP
jgi:hypothetical protein